MKLLIALAFAGSVMMAGASQAAPVGPASGAAVGADAPLVQVVRWHHRHHWRRHWHHRRWHHRRSHHRHHWRHHRGW